MKKTLKVLLSAMLIIAMTTVFAFAAEDNGEYVVLKGVEFVDQWNKAAKVNGTVKLDRDVNISNEYKLDGNRSLTIDLNGHSIKGTGTDSDYMFNILKGSSMTVMDSSEAQNGRIVVTRVYEDYDDTIIVNDGGRLILESGKLQGNEDDDCRLVAVEYGTFVMNGGSVTGNAYDGDGAGVYVNEGTFIMNGGNISDNHSARAGYSGGGIYFDGSSTSKLVITGGEIFGNSAYDGGAIYLDDGYAELTGGKIYKNQAFNTSAIKIYGNMDKVTLAGDLVITENGFERNSGAPVYSAAVTAAPSFYTTYEIHLGGRVKIYGNNSGDFCDESRRHGHHIMKDMDTSSENHAWIGIDTGMDTVGEYLNEMFVKDGQGDYSSCFFKKNRELAH